MAEFKVGDIVQLKSGGPKMTCTEISNPLHQGQVECKWFAGGKQQVGCFPPEALIFPKEESSLHEIVESIEREETLQREARENTMAGESALYIRAKASHADTWLAGMFLGRSGESVLDPKCINV